MFRVLLLLSLTACSGSSMSSGDDDPTPDAVIPPSLNPADCTPFAQSFANAATMCGTPLPSGGQAAFEGFCKKGVNAAAMCGGDPAAGLACFKSPDPSDWVCSFGDVYPACNGDLAAALGAMCLIALGNPQCASGIECSFDADCSGSSVCNSATGQCMSTTAYCIGLPCKYDVDCPQGEKCNSTEGACVGD
jgi:hypothetical protein